MITAQTVQLLDANNKNISPATNIESVYFEGTISPTAPDTYRFALRDKLIVGGRLETIEPTVNGSTNLYIPYMTATKAFNSSTGVWQIDSNKYDMGPLMNDFIDAACRDTYVKNSSLSANYLDIAGTNRMRGSVKIAGGVEYGPDGIDTSSVNPTAYVHLNSTSMGVEIYGQNSVMMNSGENCVGANESNVRMAYGTDTIITGSSSGISAQTANDVSINAMNILMGARSSISVNAGAISLDAITTVNIDAGSVELYGKEFPQPLSGYNTRLLSQTPAGDMEWVSIGHLDIHGFGSEQMTKRISYIEDSSLTAAIVTFRGSDVIYPVIDQTPVEIKMKSMKSGEVEFSLDASVTPSVHVSTINGQSMLSARQENIQLPTTDDVNMAISTKIKSGSPQNVALLNIVGNDQTFEFTPSSVTVVDDIVYAKAFAMKSDRSLKTDIREDCFDREMPALHGFKWIDSSVQSYGFIAQELEESGFQELVHETPDGNKTVDYMAALSYKIARLENENKRLWQEIEELKKKI